MSAETAAKSGTTSPHWMEALRLDVKLMTPTPTKPPTMEPITLAVYDKTLFRKALVGKAIVNFGRWVWVWVLGCESNRCVWCAGWVTDRMRQKDVLGQWDKFQLSPQWIKLKGGPHASKHVGDVMVAFELLRYTPSGGWLSLLTSRQGPVGWFRWMDG